MWLWLQKLGSPKTCYRCCAVCQPWFLLLCLLLGIYGLYASLYLAPPDYQQGDAFRIIYLHVPAAALSLFIYVSITIASVIFLIWKIQVAEMFVKASLPLGALFTALTLITGSLWGRPMWGTYWIWDARLTSELFLLFIYFAIMALRSALPDPKISSKAGAIFIIIGAVDLPIIHYSVDWWNTLHQGPTLFQFAKPTIAPAMLHPLIVMLLAFLFYYLWCVCVRMRVLITIKMAPML